jgi:hypothetical protein
MGGFRAPERSAVVPKWPITPAFGARAKTQLLVARGQADQRRREPSVKGDAG